VKVYVFLNKPILNIVPDMFPEFDFEGVELRKRNILQLNVKKKLRQCDCVFDVTMGDSFSDIYSKSLCLLNIKYKKLAARYAKHYVLLPQTYGPFEDLNVLLKALQVLEKADLVCCVDSDISSLLRFYYPFAKDRIIHFSPVIPDPYGGNKEVYAACLGLMAEQIDKLVSEL
jgi:hypothetical protein